MHVVASLARLEQRLADARAAAPGGPPELAALVELAARLVSDPHRRGELAREGVVLATRLGDDVARLRCQAMVAEFVSRRERASDALPDALATLAEAEVVGDPLALAQAHHSVAHCFDALDCMPEALEHVQRGLDGYQTAGDRFGEGRMLSFMAALSWQLGERVEARELYERAHGIFIDCDDPSGAGVMLACVAGLERELGNAEAAISTCERALEEFERAGMPLDAVIAMKAYVEALAAVGRRDVAALWAKRAAEHNRLPEGGLANPMYEVGILTITARSIHLPGGDLDSARIALERALEIADSGGMLSLAAEAELVLAETLFEGGDAVSAYHHLRRGQKLSEEVAEAAHDRRVRTLRVRFELEQARRDAVRYREQAHAQAGVIAELERTRAELAARVADLQRLNAEVVHLSRTDPLTGIANRRFMRERLDDLTAASARYGTALAVAVFDVDWFKEINDRHGHETGDAVLVALTGIMRRQFRSTDLPARLGGDEFVILMPGTGPDAAVAACTRLQRAVRSHPWARLASGLKVTITIGVADGTGQADPESVLRLADAALYRGKHAGRDTVTRH